MSTMTKMLEMGYTLPGDSRGDVNSKINNPGPLAGLTKALSHLITQKQLGDEENQKKIKDQEDTYRTLRQAGYSPAKAHQAVITGNYPKEVGDETDETGLKSAKTKADTEKVIAETDAASLKKNTVEARIMNKIANGEPLTTGEETIYNDVIKKKNNGGLAELLSQLEPESEETPLDADVPMIAPDGTRGKVKASKVAGFVAKGYKKAATK